MKTEYSVSDLILGVCLV